ncbi:MAG: hypothetical protein ALECFALPRED_000243 [Alectoria fallacina]|uniref:Kinesin light chain n=1 Tax=Alectoria fallacina TaxID=1903189 RepID=A0A8H3F3R4_9LECA|nr:MAG: hypothetical protein ALECFALPRED_000243 [Alectoria fallacina]
MSKSSINILCAGQIERSRSARGGGSPGDESREKLGKHHLSTLTATSDLATTYIHQNKWTEAGTMLEEAAAASSKQALGPEHPETLSTLDKLGQCLLSTRRGGPRRKISLLAERASSRRGSLAPSIPPRSTPHAGFGRDVSGEGTGQDGGESLELHHKRVCWPSGSKSWA